MLGIIKHNFKYLTNNNTNHRSLHLVDVGAVSVIH